MRKAVGWGAGLGLLLLLLVGWQWPDNRLHLIQCDVGQGDASVIASGFDQVLIDGGPVNGQVLKCLGQVMPFWDRKLELVMVTHPEADHIGGLVEVLQRYQVDWLVVPGVIKDTELFWQLVETARQQHIRVEIAAAGERIALGEMRWQVLWPENADDERVEGVWRQAEGRAASVNESKEGEAEVNQASLVVELKYGAIEALFTGDIDTTIEQELLAKGRLADIDLLKVAHHGSKTGTSEVFLEVTKPEWVVIGVGRQNRYGHPHDEVIARLRERQIHIGRTDKNGITHNQ